MTEKENREDWIMYMLTAFSQTSTLTISKIRQMLALKEELESKMKNVLESSFNRELLDTMFSLPYLKIETLEKRKIAHRQTASGWLKKLVDSGILHPEKKGRATYYINQGLMNIIAPK